MTQYIFDLYATLIDIHTDETQKHLWKRMASWYACFGAVYAPEQLHQSYLRMVQEETERIHEPWPEIDLKKVFLRLWKEAPASCTPAYACTDDAFVNAAGSMFRILSRKKMHMYPGTIETLQKLKAAGHGIWLLSNAQSVFTVPELVQTGLYDLFDGISISSDAGIRKPQKEFLEELLQKYALRKEECIMVGNDWTTDIAIAQSCNIQSIYLNTAKESSEALKEHLKQYPKGTVRVTDTITQLTGKE